MIGNDPVDPQVEAREGSSRAVDLVLQTPAPTL